MKKIFLALLTLFYISYANNTLEEYKELLENKVLILDEVKNNKTVVNSKGLKLGSSGIVIHNYKNENQIVLANAKVIKIEDSKAQIEFFAFKDLKQNDLANTKKKVSKGDTLILNYLYSKSMIIAPTQETFSSVRNTFFDNSFLHSDIFASTLKTNDNPYPTKKDIQDFAISENLGTVFIVVNKKVYIYDTKTFKTLLSYDINYDIKKEALIPFYSRVEDIKEKFYEAEKNISYEEHYKEILGLKNDK